MILFMLNFFQITRLAFLNNKAKDLKEGKNILQFFSVRIMFGTIFAEREREREITPGVKTL